MILRKIITIALITLLTYATDLSAQVKKAVIGVDGFTCSLCAKGVEGQLKALDFVKSVKANLKDASFDLEFADGKMINLSRLSSAVTNGGFTLRDLNVEATGYLNLDSPTGVTLSTGNTPVLTIDNVPDDFKTGDNVNIKGKLNIRTSTINVTSIKKL